MTVERRTVTQTDNPVYVNPAVQAPVRTQSVVSTTEVTPSGGEQICLILDTDVLWKVILH